MSLGETSNINLASSTNDDAIPLASFAVREASRFNFLKPIKFRKVSFWDFAANIAQTETAKHKFPLVKLQKVISQRKHFFTIDDETDYKRCKVQLYAKGVVLRDVVKGEYIKTKKQQACKTDDFLVAEIDAKVGGYGIVPSELENAVVSNHYYLYEIDKAQLLPEFLGLYAKTTEFAKQVKASGSTNYAAIRPAQVLAYEIPLPPLATQIALIAAYNAQMLQAEKFAAKADELEREGETYLLKELGIEIQRAEKKSGLQITNFKKIEKWGVSFLLGKTKVTRTKFEAKKISELCKIGSGGTPSRTNSDYFGGDILWVKSTEVVNDVIFDTEEKITSSGLRNSSAKIYPANSLIIAMYGQGATRARTAKLATEAATNQACAVLSDIDNDKIETDFLWLYLQGEYERLRELASGNNQPNLNAQMIADYTVVLPPKKIQKEIIEHLNSIKVEVKKIKSDAENARSKAKDDFEAALFQS
jgi:restriction endonuclease S subunit